MIEAPLAEDYLSGMTYEQLREKYSVSNDTIKLYLSDKQGNAVLHGSPGSVHNLVFTLENAGSAAQFAIR